MFSVRPNPKYIPGGVHNFWVLKPSGSSYEAVASAPAGTCSNQPICSNMISSNKGDWRAHVPDLLGLGACTNRFDTTTNEKYATSSSSASSCRTGWQIGEAAVATFSQLQQH